MAITAIPAAGVQGYVMAYTILRKLDGGELLQVATLDDLEEAQRLAEALCEYWPADYSVIALDKTGGGRHAGSYEWHAPRAVIRWLN